jgi:uncharacterized Zn finger protein (UPF0148 family)
MKRLKCQHCGELVDTLYKTGNWYCASCYIGFVVEDSPETKHVSEVRDDDSDVVTETKIFTLKQCAQLAIDAQSACNLSGVVKSFASVTETLWEEARKNNHGTNWVNSHPISKLFAEQITHLTSQTSYMTAHDECDKLTNS